MLRFGVQWAAMQQQSRPSTLLGLLGALPKRTTHTHSPPSRFDSWKVSELKEQCRTLGLRTSRPKAELIQMLEAYYKQQNELSLDAADAPNVIECESDSSVEVVHVKTTQSSACETVKAVPLEETLASLHLSPDEHAQSLSSASDLSSGSVSPDRISVDLYGSEANGVDKVLCDALYQDKQLYLRIILLEPIPLDEILGVARRANVLSGVAQRDRAMMRSWLDTQGICFYEGDLG